MRGARQTGPLWRESQEAPTAVQLKVFRKTTSKKFLKSHVCNTNLLFNLIKALAKSPLLMKILVSVGFLEEIEEVLRSASECVLGGLGDNPLRQKIPRRRGQLRTGFPFHLKLPIR